MHFTLDSVATNRPRRRTSQRTTRRVAVATPVSPTVSLDPLDSAAANEPEEEEEEEEHKPPSTSSPSPGFRESVEPAATETEPSRTNFSETATIRPTQPEELEPTIPVPEEPAPTQEDTALPTHSKSISQSGPALSHSEPAWGPLEQTATSTAPFRVCHWAANFGGMERRAGELEPMIALRPGSRRNKTTTATMTSLLGLCVHLTEVD